MQKYALARNRYPLVVQLFDVSFEDDGEHFAAKAAAFLMVGVVLSFLAFEPNLHVVVLGLVGELCLLDESPRAVSAIAYEDVSLLFITKKNFDNMIAEYPVQGAQLLKGMLFSVSKRLKGCYDRLAAVF